ncbi:MAG: SDR family oxidoreductase [Elusimicrobia bacterium]|nr:SDR family oxidoreductase [Elusimicrobiota bacterium]
MGAELRVLDTLAGKRILVTGSTGFLGKVTLSMLLFRQPKIETLYVLVRPSSDKDASERFFELAGESPVFEPLRGEWEDECGTFLREKVKVLAGEMTQPDCGLSEEALAPLVGKVDLVLNVAGLVAMHAGLDDSFWINALGALHVGKLAKKLGAKLVHLSTAYVAGNRSGVIPEDAPITGYFPLQGRMDSHFAVEREVSECERFIGELKSRAKEQKVQALLREEVMRGRQGRAAVAELNVEGSLNRRTKRWIDEQFVILGRRRAHHWGWPNVYCYTKAMGEQILETVEGLDYAIVRPTIVESSVKFPFQGWNEGMNTSAPIVYAILRGHILWPIRGRYALDVIPVDYVAAATLAVSAAVLAGEHDRIYHLGTSDSNPLLLRRCTRYISQYRRKHLKDFATQPGFLSWLRARIGVLRVPYPAYRGFGAPSRRAALAQMIAVLEKTSPTGVPRALTKMERELGQVEHVVQTFLPFIHDNRFVFRTDNIRRLYARMRVEDREAFPWEPEQIRWKTYWQNVHIEGLRRWVFPNGSGAIPRTGPKLHMPGRASRVVRRFLGFGQRVIYGSLFDSRACGAAPVAADRRFVVAAGNHASHLDMGLIKHCMGPAGRDLSALGAADYFFKNPFKRFFFKNFTNLIPMSRDRTFKESIILAAEAQRKGRNVLIFPEGGRGPGNEVRAFKPSVGFMVLRNQVDVLPVYIEGTCAGWPKGAWIPRFGKRLDVHFGAPISHEELEAKTKGLPQKEAYRAATALIEEAVKSLEREHGRCRA